MSRNRGIVSLAPMMSFTDRHFRHMMRLVSPNMTLYTEMVVADSLVNNPRLIEQHLSHGPPGTPPMELCVLQLGGSVPTSLYQACRIVASLSNVHQYSAINLNCGCPSKKVVRERKSNGTTSSVGFGAVLMHEPNTVAECCNAMRDGYMQGLKDIGQTGVAPPITVKHRIGTDVVSDYNSLCEFVRIVSSVGGVTHFVVHARIAILNMKMTPKENRTIPPLNAEVVFQLARDFPNLTFDINGGYATVMDAFTMFDTAPNNVVGVMIGRGMTTDTWSWSQTDALFYPESSASGVRTRRELITRYVEHIAAEERQHGLKRIRRSAVRPLTSLFYGETHNCKWREEIDRIMKSDGSCNIKDMILRACETVTEDALDKPYS